jgi:hypothetical protein
MSLNPDQQLARIRELADLADRTTDTADLDRFTDAFRALDAHLSAGGIPPEAWREGSDAPADDAPEWAEDEDEGMAYGYDVTTGVPYTGA